MKTAEQLKIVAEKTSYGLLSQVVSELEATDDGDPSITFGTTLDQAEPIILDIDGQLLTCHGANRVSLFTNLDIAFDDNCASSFGVRCNKITSGTEILFSIGGPRVRRYAPDSAQNVTVWWRGKPCIVLVCHGWPIDIYTNYPKIDGFTVTVVGIWHELFQDVSLLPDE